MISGLMLIGLLLVIIIAFTGGLITGVFLLDKDYPVEQQHEREEYKPPYEIFSPDKDAPLETPSKYIRFITKAGADGMNDLIK